MWENVVEQDRPQMAVRRMRFAYWVPKATDTHFGCEVLTALLQQQWYANAPPYYVYTYTASLVVTRTSWLNPPRELEIISFCCENYMKHTNILCGESVEFQNLK